MNSRKLNDLVCGGKNDFYFLVKWEGKPFKDCSWECEYFLRDQYDHVLLFAAQKCSQQPSQKKGKSLSTIRSLEDNITCRRFSVRGLDLFIPESVSRRITLAFDDELTSKQDVCLQATSGYDLSILIYLHQFKPKAQQRWPTLILCESQDVQRWKTLLALYFPQWLVLTLELSVALDETLWSSDFAENKSSLDNSDIVLVDLDTARQIFHRIIKLDWDFIVMDALVPTDLVFKIMDLFNKPFYRTNARRIACIPALTVQSVGKAVINQTISLQVALRRFVRSPKLNYALLAQGLFPSASEDTIEFYLSTTPGTSLLSSVPSSELPALENRLERPLFTSPISVVSKLVMRTLILRQSDLCKAEYGRLLSENCEWLADCEKNKKQAESSRPRLADLCNLLVKIDDQINTKIVEDDSKTLEIDAKLRWIIKYLEALKLRGHTGRIVLLFVSEKAQIRAFPVLQRFTKYCCWQINDNVDSAEVNIRVAEFSRVEHKMTVLTVNYKNIWKLAGVRSNLVFLMGQTGEASQAELKVKFCQK